MPVDREHWLGNARRAGLRQDTFPRSLCAREVGGPDIEGAGAIVRLAAAVGGDEEPLGIQDQRPGVHALRAPRRVERDRVEQHFELDARGEAQLAIDRIARCPCVERGRKPALQHESAK